MNAQSTIQTIGSAYPFNASANGMVPVIATAATPNKITAPIGAGRMIEPTMHARKMARRRQCWGRIPAGGPGSRMTTATPTTRAQRHSRRGRSSVGVSPGGRSGAVMVLEVERPV